MLNAFDVINKLGLYNYSNAIHCYSFLWC